MVERKGNANRKAQASVGAARDGARHFRVHSSVAVATASRAVFKVYKREILILPDTVLIELDRRGIARSIEQGDAGDKEAQIGRSHCGWFVSNPGVFLAAGKRLAAEAAGKANANGLGSGRLCMCGGCAEAEKQHDGGREL